MAPARRVGSGFFPLDEELALLPGSLTPTQQEHLVHLATWMPFARAGELLKRLLGVQVSAATVRRLSEAAGATLEQGQTRASQGDAEWEEPAPLTRPTENKLVLSADGAYVPLVKGEWAEVRTLAIGTVAALPSTSDQEVRTSAWSYFSRLADAATFADLAEVETRRRGVTWAKQVCAVTDGADWLQGFIDLHRPDALRILDFPHAAQRVGAMADLFVQSGHLLPEDWVHQQCHHLKHEGPRGVLETLRALPSPGTVAEALQEHRQYLEKRAGLMDYPTYRQQGWPIGSGSVESANKRVMQARLNGAGMRWARAHVNPMLALRTAVCNERWDESWQAVRKAVGRQRTQQRQQRASSRLTRLLTRVLVLVVRLRPQTPSPLPPPRLPPPPPATLPGSYRPSAHHPWQRSIISPAKRRAKI
jgi:hypothetical protein